MNPKEIKGFGDPFGTWDCANVIKLVFSIPRDLPSFDLQLLAGISYEVCFFMSVAYIILYMTYVYHDSTKFNLLGGRKMCATYPNPIWQRSGTDVRWPGMTQTFAGFLSGLLLEAPESEQRETQTGQMDTNGGFDPSEKCQPVGITLW